MAFSIVKKGYAPAEVDAYIAKTAQDAANLRDEQHARIDALLHENEQLKAELLPLRAQKEQIGKAILGAVKKADEIEKLSRDKYVREIKRLKAFHEKWTAYYDRLFKAYPLDDQLAELGAFNRRMDEVLRGVRSDETAATAAQNQKKVQIGYIAVDAAERGADVGFDDIVPDADPSSPVLTGNFDPLERINRYFEAEKERAATEEKTKNLKYDRSESGFSLEEALNPTEELADILKDLGL